MKKRYLSFALIALLLVTGMFSCSKSSTVTPPKETVLYQTDFSSNDGRWVVGTISGGGATYYQNGNYFVVGGIGTYTYIKSNTGGATFTYSCISNVFNGSSGNIAAEASIKMSSAPNGAGMVWNFQSGGQNTSFYVFEINTSGQWGIYQYQLVNATTNPNIYSITTITSGTANSIIQQNQFNKLQIAQNNGQLQFSVNGTQVSTMNATGNTLDQVGLFADVHSILQASSFEAVEWE